MEQVSIDGEQGQVLSPGRPDSYKLRKKGKLIKQNELAVSK